MKKLLLSTIVLVLFSLSIILFQISCKKEANAQAPSNYDLPIASKTKLGGVMVDGTTIAVDSKGTISMVPFATAPDVFIFVNESEEAIYRMNSDGTGKQRVNIALPPGLSGIETDEGVQLTKGNRIIFISERGLNKVMVSCDLNGQNAIELGPGERVLL